MTELQFQFNSITQSANYIMLTDKLEEAIGFRRWKCANPQILSLHQSAIFIKDQHLHQQHLRSAVRMHFLLNNNNNSGWGQIQNNGRIATKASSDATLHTTVKHAVIISTASSAAKLLSCQVPAVYYQSILNTFK